MAKYGIPLVGQIPLFEYPLGQCLLYYNGFLLGKTTSDTILKVDRDIKDILYSQDGTKAQDWVNTGELYSIEVTFGETTEELISVLDPSWTIDNDGNALLGRDLYESYRESRGAEMKLIKVDGNGQPIAGDTYVFNFWEAVPVVNGEIMQFGADTQKNFQCAFYFGYHVFAAGESSTHYGGYGYIGDATDLDVPAIEWPPVPQTSIATGTVTPDAQTITITFDREIEFQGGSYTTNTVEVTVEGTTTGFTANVTVSTNDLVLDVDAEGIGTIGVGDTVTVNILAGCIQGASDNKAFPFVTNLVTLNNITAT